MEILEPYERRVEPARKQLMAWSNRLIYELDEDNGGGYTWWSGHADWTTLTLLADYLIQSVSGASTSLLAASYETERYRQLRHAQDWDLKKILLRARAGEFDNPIDALGRELHQTKTGKRRSMETALSVEHIFFHLGQTLDRIAAALLIVGGFDVKNVAGADWSRVDGLAKTVGDDPGTAACATYGSVGRGLQVELLAPVSNSDAFGTTDWLTWMRETRNALTHRAPARNLNILLKDDRLESPLYRQPKWSDVQTRIYGNPDGTGFARANLPTGTVETLEGLVDSTTSFVRDLTTRMTECWTSRRTNPSTLIQPNRQWPSAEPQVPRLSFRGYGQEFELPNADYIAVNPLDVKRFNAAFITDDRLSRWAADSASFE